MTKAWNCLRTWESRPHKCSAKPKHNSISKQFGLASCLDLLQILHPHLSSGWLGCFFKIHHARCYFRNLGEWQYFATHHFFADTIEIKQMFWIFSCKPSFFASQFSMCTASWLHTGSLPGINLLKSWLWQPRMKWQGKAWMDSMHEIAWVFANLPIPNKTCPQL